MGDSEGNVRTLSTGERISLPLSLSCSLVGGIFAADADRLGELVPEPLTPLRLAPGVGTVTLVGIDYRDVGGLEPYREFAVIVPTVRNGLADAPILEAVGADIGGYVHYLPVTTASSVALGTEIWGYPKEVADVAFDRGNDRATVTLATEEGRVCRLSCPHARGGDAAFTTDSYAVREGQLLRIGAEIEGPLSIRPDLRATVAFGDGDRGRELRSLVAGRRSIATLTGRGLTARLGAGEPVAEIDPEA